MSHQKLKVLIVSYYFPPLNSVASLRPYYFAKALAALGNDVFVLTAEKPKISQPIDLDLKDLNMIVVRSKVLNWIYERFGVNKSGGGGVEREGMVKAALRQFRISRGIGFLGRMPDVLDLWVRPALREVSDREWDVVITSYGPYACHTIGYRLRKHGYTTKWIADYRDLWTQHHIFKGALPFSILENYLERKYLKAADEITTVSEGLAKKLKALSGKNVWCIQGGSNAKQLLRLDPNPVVTTGKLTLAYTGTLYPDHPNLGNFFDALSHAKTLGDTTQLEVLFCGADLFGLSEEVSRRNLGDIVSWVGQQPREYALRLQRDCDVLLFFDFPAIDGVITGKVFEYLQAGRPIWVVGLEDTEARLLIENAGALLFENTESIASGIAKLNQRPELSISPNLEVLASIEEDSLGNRLEAVIYGA